MTTDTALLAPQAGRFWRIMWAGDTDALMLAHASEGRFHHSGQYTLYLSATPEGYAVAIKRYMRPASQSRFASAQT